MVQGVIAPEAAFTAPEAAFTAPEAAFTAPEAAFTATADSDSDGLTARGQIR